MQNFKNKALLEPDWFSISKIKNYKKEDFDKLLKSYLKNKKEVYSKIKSLKKEERNFENTILALENCDSDFEVQLNQIGINALTHTKKVCRDLANDFEKRLSQKSVDIEYDKDIYKAIIEYKEGNFQKERRSLDKKYGIGSVKLAQDVYKSYKRMGFDLKIEEQKLLKQNLKKLSKLSVDFSQNINEYKDYILCNKEELKGLPENTISSLKKAGDKYIVSLEYPEYIPFIQFAKNREKRQELAEKNYKKGGNQNIKLLSKIVSLRAEVAKLLKYKNYVDYRSETRMAKNSRNIQFFIDSLIEKLESKSQKELKELEVFAKNNLENYKDIDKLEYFDISFVATKMKEKKYGYDAAKLKEYFELERVISTTFSIFGEIFGFSVREIEKSELQKMKIKFVDPKVKLYKLKDFESGSVISCFVLDLFPRGGKRGHACSTSFIDGGKRGGNKIIPVNQIICNFPKPNKNFPSLLSLGEVETFFHEFGHALHYMLTNVTYSSQAGYNVVWDFVEAPSQFMENFLFEKRYLKRLAVHYKTKESLDEKTLNNILKSRNFMSGYTNLRQLIFAKFDLDLHFGKIKPEDSAKYYNSLSKKYFDFDLPKDAIFPAGFGHLMGYAASYYSYMWALVYAYDFYSEFKKVLNNKKKLKEVAKRYKKEILEVGGSREEEESVKKFLGRKANNKAFLENIFENK